MASALRGPSILGETKTGQPAAAAIARSDKGMPAIFKAAVIFLIAPPYPDRGEDDERMATPADGGRVD